MIDRIAPQFCRYEPRYMHSDYAGGADRTWITASNGSGDAAVSPMYGWASSNTRNRSGGCQHAHGRDQRVVNGGFLDAVNDDATKDQPAEQEEDYPHRPR